MIAVRRRLCVGLASGVVGTCAIALSDRIERFVAGGELTYAPRLIAWRLNRRLQLGIGDGALGRALRWTYGPLLGAAGELVVPQALRGIERALAVAGGVYAAEVSLFPLVGATPPARLWPKSHVALLALHTLVFGLSAAAARALLLRVHDRMAPRTS